MKRLFLLVAAYALFVVSAYAQQDTATTPTNVKKGLTFGAVPAIAFDTDTGFKYGGLVNFYWYGDGHTYPEYMHSLYLEWSRTTKGSGINEIMYDSRYLIPKTRVQIDFGLFTEQGLDFYGFNGYDVNFDFDFTDNSGDIPNPNRMYYRYDRKVLRFTSDFQYELMGKKLAAFAGFGYFGNTIGPVDVADLNDGKDDDELLKDTSLLRNYLDWGVIPQDQGDGGNVSQFKLGLVFDTRDNEPNPMKGMWSELLLTTAPSFSGNDYSYTQLSFTHRQYFTLVPNILSFAWRGAIQTKVAGDIPFYMLSYYQNSKQTREGLGGGKSLRGILRNRVIGDGVAFSNFEFRWKFLRTVLWKQNFYIALNTFADMGQVIQKYEVNTTGVPAAFLSEFKTDAEKLHISYGAGLRFVLNENFIVAIDYGMAPNKQDGTSGMYIGLNFLY